MTLAARLEGVKTVSVAVPDNVGRLMGKRLPTDTFRRIIDAGMAMPDYFLVTWLDNQPQDGFDVTGWHTGWRNCTLVPDVSTLHPLPWDTSAAIVLCDTLLADGAPAPMAARQLLAAQVDRARERGIFPVCAVELEFWLFNETYQSTHEKGYRDLVPSHHRVQDNDLLQAGADEPFISTVRESLLALGVDVELSQGEGGEGQHEITLRHCPMPEAADRGVLYKHALKELAQRAGQAVTFMAKWRPDLAGSSGHIHLSLDDAAGRPLLWDDQRNGLSDDGQAFLAGLVRYTPELMVMHAPYANSYRRLVDGSFAPTNTSWGHDNRSACFRLVGRGPSFRIECRMPGADINPYWSFAAVLAAGLAGIEDGLDLPPQSRGNAYADPAAAPLPRDLTEALAVFRGSSVARSGFGEPVHTHLTRLLSAELADARRAVSQWEVERAFERC
jgi:glutamine synthetase